MKTYKTYNTALHFAEYVGAIGFLSIEKFFIKVTVIDARECYGRIDLLVTPYHGERGEQWVSLDRVNFES